MEQTENTLIYNLKVSEDGSIVAGAAEDGSIKLYREDKEGPVLYNSLSFHKAAVFDVCFFREKLISASYDGDVAFWRREAQGFIFEKSIHLFPGAINSLCVYEDRILCGCSDGNIRSLSAEGEILSDVSAHRYGVTGLFAWKSLLVSGGMDGAVKIWKAEDMTLLKELKDHTAPVRDCKVSPSSFGKLVFASCSEDGTAIVYSRRGRGNKQEEKEGEEEEEEPSAEEEADASTLGFRAEKLQIGEPCTRVAWTRSGYGLIVGYGEGNGKLFVPNGPIKWTESDALLP